MLSLGLKDQSDAFCSILVEVAVLSKNFECPNHQRTIMGLDFSDSLAPGTKKLRQILDVSGTDRQCLGSHHKFGKSHMISPAEECLLLTVQNAVSDKSG